MECSNTRGKKTSKKTHFFYQLKYCSMWRWKRCAQLKFCQIVSTIKDRINFFSFRLKKRNEKVFPLNFRRTSPIRRNIFAVARIHFDLLHRHNIFDKHKVSWIFGFPIFQVIETLNCISHFIFSLLSFVYVFFEDMSQLSSTTLTFWHSITHGTSTREWD